MEQDKISTSSCKQGHITNVQVQVQSILCRAHSSWTMSFGSLTRPSYWNDYLLFQIGQQLVYVESNPASTDLFLFDVCCGRSSRYRSPPSRPSGLSKGSGRSSDDSRCICHQTNYGRTSHLSATPDLASTIPTSSDVFTTRLAPANLAVCRPARPIWYRLSSLWPI